MMIGRLERRLIFCDVRNFSSSFTLLSTTHMYTAEHSIECPICYDDCKGVRLLNCGHDFCETCITTHVRMKVKRGEVLPSQLRCPMPECLAEIHPSDVLLALQDEKQRDRYHRLTVQKFVDNDDEAACCPTAGCEYKFWFDATYRKLDCPSCSKVYCVSCRSDWHEGKTCEEFRAEQKVDSDDEEFQKYVNTKKLKQCPKCKHWIERTQGCDAMTCRCGLVFCYNCGGCRKFGKNKDIDKICRCGNDRLLAAHETPEVLFLPEQQRRRQHNWTFNEHRRQQIFRAREVRLRMEQESRADRNRRLRRKAKEQVKKLRREGGPCPRSRRRKCDATCKICKGSGYVEPEWAVDLI